MLLVALVALLLLLLLRWLAPVPDVQLENPRVVAAQCDGLRHGKEEEVGGGLGCVKQRGLKEAPGG
jgi:hypothetical protein